MRGAMIHRRIDKERRRKAEINEKELARRRGNIQKMNAGLAKAFSKMIKVRNEQDKLSNIERRGTMAGAGDKLRALLVQWKKGIDNTHLYRDQDVLAMEAPEIERKRLEAEAAAKAKAEAASQDGMKYNIEELYKKILKVEKLSDIVKVNNTHGRRAE